MDQHRQDDQALIVRIARGDRLALEALYRLHAPWLLDRLQRRSNDPDAADTALQDTFVAVWQSAKKYRGEGDVGAWLWGIAVRRLIDQMRKRKPVPVVIDDHQMGSVTFEEELVGAFGPVAQQVAGLEPELRDVLVATAIDGLTTKEAGRLLGVPQGTVKTRLARARRQLQEVSS